MDDRPSWSSAHPSRRWSAGLVAALSAVMVAGCSIGGGSDPGHFEGSGTACGTYRVSNDPTSVTEEVDDAQRCLVAAFEAGDLAWLSVVAHTAEGHPFRIGFQVQGDQSVLVETDWNDDPLGPDGIERRTCGALDAGGGGVPASLDCTG